MTAQDKAKYLFDSIRPLCRDSDSAKIIMRIFIEEILNTKNFESTLNKELVAFENTYWQYVMADIMKLN